MATERKQIEVEIREFPAVQRTGLISFVRSIDLELHFDPARIGAKPGDKVEVQLLHCPSGWSWLMPDLEQLASLPEHTSGARLSNRITLPASRGESREGN